MDIKRAAQAAHCNAVAKGFWEDVDPVPNLPTSIALMHSELSEALEEFRNGHEPTEIYYNEEKPEKPEGVGIEFADAVIRIMDVSEALGIDLEHCIRLKMAYNTSRPYKHGGKKI